MQYNTIHMITYYEGIVFLYSISKGEKSKYVIYVKRAKNAELQAFFTMHPCGARRIMLKSIY